MVFFTCAYFSANVCSASRTSSGTVLLISSISSRSWPQGDAAKDELRSAAGEKGVVVDAAEGDVAFLEVPSIEMPRFHCFFEGVVVGLPSDSRSTPADVWVTGSSG